MAELVRKNKLADGPGATRASANRGRRRTVFVLQMLHMRLMLQRRRLRVSEYRRVALELLTNMLPTDGVREVATNKRPDVEVLPISPPGEKDTREEGAGGAGGKLPSQRGHLERTTSVLAKTRRREWDNPLTPLVHQTSACDGAEPRIGASQTEGEERRRRRRRRWWREELGKDSENEGDWKATKSWDEHREPFTSLTPAAWKNINKATVTGTSSIHHEYRQQERRYVRGKQSHSIHKLLKCQCALTLELEDPSEESFLVAVVKPELTRGGLVCGGVSPAGPTLTLTLTPRVGRNMEKLQQLLSNHSQTLLPSSLRVILYIVITVIITIFHLLFMSTSVTVISSIINLIAI
ncbi:hypothetical protein INR49_027949 [Caranx melampygus]|nr:hypothetical protein INR49_027949 [Caranx melampygus]